ncbi:uncharacterized protein EAF02_010637 [Botrytis sinoallii]|uniref:uncharacterized protein n=1 Tax=Botrytis sinoallii TaxID=1463999 RepID=UPI001900BBD3|nr:uncharacterized protein EAF02_010637 [Botrytis sinoallii]KAF7861683.1 hypothetical protein EAF02_010637 [Botrytis sinoallii]
MGVISIITSLTPGDPRSRHPLPRREDNNRETSRRAPTFSLPRYEAAPPSYESLSTASAKFEGAVSKSDSHRAIPRPNSEGLVAHSGSSNRPQSSHSLKKERPHSSYASKVDRRFSQASFEESRHSSGGEPDLSHEPTKDRRRSATAIRSEGDSRHQTRHDSTSVYNQQSASYNHSIDEASRFPRSAEQARVTTGFATFDEWCSNRSK